MVIDLCVIICACLHKSQARTGGVANVEVVGDGLGGVSSV